MPFGARGKAKGLGSGWRLAPVSPQTRLKHLGQAAALVRVVAMAAVGDAFRYD